MQICRVSAPSQQFIKFLTGGLHLKINVSYTKTTVQDSNVEDSCPMIIDDETQIEPQELTFAQKLQVKLDEARLKKPSIHSNTIDIE